MYLHATISDRDLIRFGELTCPDPDDARYRIDGEQLVRLRPGYIALWVNAAALATLIFEGDRQRGIDPWRAVEPSLVAISGGSDAEPDERKVELERAAQHWDALADAELDPATRDPYGHPSAAEARADSYRRTAKSLRLEIETGRPHCSCCLSPDKWYGAPIAGGSEDGQPRQRRGARPGGGGVPRAVGADGGATTMTTKPFTPVQASVLRRVAAGAMIRTQGLYGYWLGADAISGMTVRVLRRQGLIELQDHGYVVTEAGKAEAARLGH